MSFLKDRDFGESGEVYLQGYFSGKNIESSIVNLPDYDIIWNEGGVTFEVKSDRWGYKTGNLCIELYSHIGLKNRGWVQCSSADYLAYILFNESGTSVKDVMFYDLPSLRSYIFHDVMGGRWTNNKPKLGRIVRASNNKNVRNLLVRIDDLTNLEKEVV